MCVCVCVCVAKGQGLSWVQWLSIPGPGRKRRCARDAQWQTGEDQQLDQGANSLHLPKPLFSPPFPSLLKIEIQLKLQFPSSTPRRADLKLQLLGVGRELLRTHPLPCDCFSAVFQGGGRKEKQVSHVTAHGEFGQASLGR